MTSTFLKLLQIHVRPNVLGRIRCRLWSEAQKGSSVVVAIQALECACGLVRHSFM